MRTCAACGARVGVLADVCPACGGNPDVRYIELGPIGSRPPAPGSRRGRRPPGRRRQWAPIVAVVVVLWGFLALTARGTGDPDDEEADRAGATSSTAPGRETTTTRRPRPTTTTTEKVLPGAPLLGAPNGLGMILVGDARTTYVDLDSGQFRRLPASAVVGLTPAGLLVLAGDLEIWPPPYDGGAAVTLRGSGVEQAWGSPYSTAVWLTTGFEGTGRRAVLVDLSGHELASRELTGSVWPTAAVDAGLVLASPGGVYVLHPDGTVDRVSTGDAVTAAGDRIIVSNCDEELRCAYEVLDASGRLLDRVDQDGDEEYYGVVAAVSSDGRIAYQMNDGTILVDGEAVADGPSYGQATSAMAWSADGRWLALAFPSGVWFLDTTTEAPPIVVDLPIPTQPVWQLFLVPSG